MMTEWWTIAAKTVAAIDLMPKIRSEPVLAESAAATVLNG